VVALMSAGCQQEQKPAVVARAELKTMGGSTVEFIPKEGQHPYCLLYTVSEKGVIRQLTMTRENRSIKCDPGKPIYNTSFRVPVEEGKVRAYIFFSDQRINAGSVAQQLFDLREKPKLTAMDFRLPGSVSMETLEFVPQAGGEPVMGAVIGTTDIAVDAPAEAAEGEEPGMQLTAPSEGTKPTPPGGEGSGTKTAADASH
jgi:hypothetical protein